MKIGEKLKYDTPLYVALDHDNHELRTIVAQIIAKYGRKGKRLFIEGLPFRRNEYVRGNEPPFPTAVLTARAKKMRVFFLDTALETQIAERYNEHAQHFEYSYMTFNLRERRWLRLLRKHAESGDIVILHPNHLSRMTKQMPPARKNILWVSRPKRFYDLEDIPLTLSELKKLRAWRVLERRERAKIKPLIRKRRNK